MYAQCERFQYCTPAEKCCHMTATAFTSAILISYFLTHAGMMSQSLYAIKIILSNVLVGPCKALVSYLSLEPTFSFRSSHFFTFFSRDYHVFIRSLIRFRKLATLIAEGTTRGFDFICHNIRTIPWIAISASCRSPTDGT